VRLLLPEDSDPLHKISIVPRGRSLGVTHSMPEREKYITTKEEMEASIMAALGGRASEELVFNKLTTGAYSDFKVATSIARDMICNYGMSSELGQVIYIQGQANQDYSQGTAERIDKEVQNLIQQSYTKALGLLKKYRDKLDMLANALIEKETLYAGEIYKLLDIEPRVEHKFS